MMRRHSFSVSLGVPGEFGGIFKESEDSFLGNLRINNMKRTR